MSNLPTLAEITKAVGGTWFDDDGSDSSLVSISSRNYGDVGGERAGQPDITEAKRIIKILKEAYPDLDITGDTCDEWVSVEIRNK